MSATPNQSNLEAAIAKLHASCSAHSPLKSDEELAATFESFVVSNFEQLGNAEKENLLNNFKSIEEGLSVLYELEACVIADGDHFFASLKHPSE